MTMPSRRNLQPARRRKALAGLAMLSLAALSASSQAAPTGAPPEAKLLAPHRAVYDVALVNAGSSSGISDIKGRLVFEFTGSVCEGFTQNMRFVMSVSNREGAATTNDSRSSTWEEAGGGRFRFSVNNYENDNQSEQTSGNALRDSGEGLVKVDLAQPKTETLKLSGGVLFPVQHTIALLSAALRGDTLFTADLYDGSDKGEKVFFTTSVIGRMHPAGQAETLEAVKNVEKLADLPSWPVTISYYDQGSDRSEGVPLHEMSFRFYENGVVRSLKIDYGNVIVTGTLSQLDFYEQAKCE